MGADKDKGATSEWCWVRHSEIAVINPKKPELNEDAVVSFVPMAAVPEEVGTAELEEERTFSQVKKGYTSFQDGDILFAKITPCMENGKVALVEGLRSGFGFGSTEFHVSRLHPDLCKEFYLHFFMSHQFRAGAQRNMSGSAGQLRVPKHYFADVELPLPPLNEQRRIVAKIEVLFSQLDKGVESLKTARAQLKTYGQSLLKAAFEGRLTEQWRRDNADKLETADQLLQRIREEREVRYQQQVEEWKTDVAKWESYGRLGKRPKKPATAFYFHDEESSNRDNLSELPSSWRWVEIGDLFSVYVGATPSRKEPLYWGGAINWVSSGEVAFCQIRDTKEKITSEGLENTSTTIHPEGTVILAMIGEGKTRGQAAILRVRAAHNQNTAAIRVPEAGLESAYIYYYFMYRYEETRMVGSGNNQKALNKSRVQRMLLPLAPENEQTTISRIIEQGLSAISHVEANLDDQIQKAETLRQSILKRAFEGQLVSQDPDDEPASALLERIRQEQADAPKPKRRKRKAEVSA